jgi:integrase
LALSITDKGTRSWTLRVMVGGKRKEMGLGGYPAVSLAVAREQARQQRATLASGDDPIAARKARAHELRAAEEARKIASERQGLSLGRAAREYHERVIEPNRTPKHGAQWISSLENHIPAALWNKPIGDIEPPDLLAALAAIRPHKDARNLSRGGRINETVRRIRQRLDSIFEDAAFHGRCSTNPAAAVRRKLNETASRKDGHKGAFAALPYADAPELMERLQAAEGTSARCLEFALLTVARTSESLAAEWSEIDLRARTWTLPKARMKGGEAHVVYLSDRAMALVKRQQGAHDKWLFPSPMPSRKDKPMSNMALLTVLDRLGVREQTTVHGLCRATFSTWANETGAARPDVVEACLAHDEANKVRAAYNRAEFIAERRALLQAWSEFLMTKPRGAAKRAKAAHAEQTL